MIALQMERTIHSIRIDEKIYQRLKEHVKAAGISVSRWVELEARVLLDPTVELSEMLNDLDEKARKNLRKRKEKNP